ncbi:Cro/CI family transcriptional regulator [uncultured Paraglaciecola sp.]|uniref:Cro/CI family transcriptional regulator n=1 Tax=uncultured Paraglaciecola sp. TaxID=1765024 RepID=UPI002606260A|nr:Cro/CI family transcriptional regulator [uncultured Paraglaciecola sp.]
MTARHRLAIFQTMKTPLTKEQAVSLYGSQTNLANELGVTKALVSIWPNGEPIPERYDLRIRFVLKPKGLRDLRREARLADI